MSLVEIVKQSGDLLVPIRVDVIGSESRLEASSPDIGSVSSVIPSEGELPWPFGLSAAYVKDVLTRSTEDEITFQFGPTNRHPIVVESDGVFHLFGPNQKTLK